MTLLTTACDQGDSITPAHAQDVVTLTQEGVLEIIADRYSIHPTTWKTRGRVVNAVWVDGRLVGGTIYHINPANPEEWSIIGYQAVFHFSPDPNQEPSKTN